MPESVDELLVAALAALATALVAALREYIDHAKRQSGRKRTRDEDHDNAA